MNNYISKEALKKWQVYSTERKEYVVPVNVINMMQTIEVQPVVYGEWIRVGPHDQYDFRYMCSQCGEWGKWELFAEDIYEYLYCPRCGAKMEGKNEDICN